MLSDKSLQAGRAASLRAASLAAHRRRLLRLRRCRRRPAALIAAGKHLRLPREQIRVLLSVWEAGACRDVRVELQSLVREQIAHAEQRRADLAVFVDRLTAPGPPGAAGQGRAWRTPWGTPFRRSRNMSRHVCGTDNKAEGFQHGSRYRCEIIAEVDDPRAVHVGEFAQGEAITTGADDSAEEILATVRQHQVRRLPMIDGDDLIGILALADVARGSE